MSVSISGILLDPLGQPASFAEVKFITWQGANDVLTTAPAVFKTSADGAYSFAVEFGTFTVQVRYNQSNGKFQTIKQKVIVNSNVTATTLGELLLFNEPLTPPEIAYVEQLVAEAEGYRDEAEGFALASEASSQTSEGFSQASAASAAASAQSATDAANSAALIAPVPLNGGVWASGQTYDFYNQYMIYNGEAYSPLPATVLPYTVGAAPDLGFVYQIKLNSLQELSGLTEPSDLDSVYSRTFADVAEMISFTGHEDGYSYTLDSGEFYIVEASSDVTKGDETLTGGLIAKLQTRASVKSLGYTLDQETNYAEPYYEVFKGLEYGFHLTSRVRAINGLAGLLKCVHSGDSTIAGVAAGGFDPSVVMQAFADSMGVMSTHINAGHSSQSSVQWLSTYVDQDIANHPDMDVYFARWGINDGSEHGDANLFESNLRACLTKLRAFKSVGDLTIVLMSPSSTYDIPNNRGPEWYDNLAGRIKQAARDFFCVYVDTYAMLRDSKNAAGIWMDDPFGDGRAIHPYAETNAMIYHQVAHHLFSPSIAMGATTNRFTNAKADSFTPQFAVLPSQYNRGISIFRATLAAGWPLDGFVKTVKSADNICLQTLTEYVGDRRVWTRVGSEFPSNDWGDWSSAVPVKVPVPYTANGGAVSGFEPLTIVEQGGVVTLLGATTATGDVTIASIPAGYRPRSAVGASAKSQSGGAFIPAFTTISTNGDIDISGGWGDGNNININCSWLIN